MERESREKILSYFDRFFLWLEKRTSKGDDKCLEDFRPGIEAILGPLPPGPARQGLLALIRKRTADALDQEPEPTSEKLQELEKLRENAAKIPRTSVWKSLKELVALFPRQRGHGPSPTISPKEYPNVIAAVRRETKKDPEARMLDIYKRVGEKYGAGRRVIQKIINAQNAARPAARAESADNGRDGWRTQK